MTRCRARYVPRDQRFWRGARNSPSSLYYQYAFRWFGSTGILHQIEHLVSYRLCISMSNASSSDPSPGAASPASSLETVKPAVLLIGGITHVKKEWEECSSFAELKVWIAFLSAISPADFGPDFHWWNEGGIPEILWRWKLQRCCGDLQK